MKRRARRPRRGGGRMQLERWQQVPAGTRDLLPHEAARVRAVIDRVLDRMRRWGYREVTTPTLEYLDVLVRGEGAAVGGRLFKLVDRDGELLALRPEMTTPVARLVATRLRAAPLPLRLAYAGPVFRWREAGSGRLREFPQVGGELVGAGTLAVDALRATGVGQSSVSLGHVGFLRGLLAGLGLAEPALDGVRTLLYQKDFVGLRRLLEAHGAPPPRVRAVLALPTLQGPRALEEARRLADTPELLAVVEDLAALERMLRAYGVWDTVTLDLGIIRDFDYYTGIVFEGHTTALGVPLLGGGRYDRLLERFGVPLPATGFAVRVERVLSAGEEPADAWAPDAVVAFDNGSREAALACAKQLRERGLVVAVEVQGRSWDEVARDAEARGAERALLVRGEAVLVRERGGRQRVMPLAALRDDRHSIGTVAGRRGAHARSRGLPGARGVARDASADPAGRRRHGALPDCEARGPPDVRRVRRGGPRDRGQGRAPRAGRRRLRTRRPRLWILPGRARVSRGFGRRLGAQACGEDCHEIPAGDGALLLEPRPRGRRHHDAWDGRVGPAGRPGRWDHGPRDDGAHARGQSSGRGGGTVPGDGPAGGQPRQPPQPRGRGGRRRRPAARRGRPACAGASMRPATPPDGEERPWTS